MKVQYKLQAPVYDILHAGNDAGSVGTVYYSLGARASLRHLWGTHNAVSSHNRAVMLRKAFSPLLTGPMFVRRTYFGQIDEL